MEEKNIKNRQNLALADVIDLQRLYKLLKHFVVATGFNARCYDVSGNLVLSPDACGGVMLCDAVKCKEEGLKRCVLSHKYGGEKSAELGEPYIYACHAGLILCTVPLVFNNMLLGSITSGPVLLWEPDENAVSEIDKKIKDLHIGGDLCKMTGQLKEIGCTNMHSASQLLFVMVNYMIQSSMQELEQRSKINRQQAEIAELVLDKKRAEQAMQNIEKRSLQKACYPIEKEKELVSCVQINDITSAKKILNELLGEIFFSFSGNLDNIKARLAELVSVISRAAVDAGAPFEELSELLSAFLKTLHDCGDFDRMCSITTDTLEKFLQAIYSYRSNNASAQYLANAVRYIKENFSDDLNLDTVAKNTFVSSFYLSHLFRSELNITFLDYVTKVRMEAAKAMLKNSNEKIQGIAEKCGYNDSNYFSKQFKKYWGIKPSEYRNINI